VWVEGFGHLFWELVVKDAFAAELVVFPIALIGDLAAFIV
jgi:hypothetical protein